MNRARCHKSALWRGGRRAGYTPLARGAVRQGETGSLARGAARHGETGPAPCLIRQSVFSAATRRREAPDSSKMVVAAAVR